MTEFFDSVDGFVTYEGLKSSKSIEDENAIIYFSYFKDIKTCCINFNTTAYNALISDAKFERCISSNSPAGIQWIGQKTIVQQRICSIYNSGFGGTHTSIKYSKNDEIPVYLCDISISNCNNYDIKNNCGAIYILNSSNYIRSLNISHCIYRKDAGILLESSKNTTVSYSHIYNVHAFRDWSIFSFYISGGLTKYSNFANMSQKSVRGSLIYVLEGPNMTLLRCSVTDVPNNNTVLYGYKGSTMTVISCYIPDANISGSVIFEDNETVFFTNLNIYYPCSYEFELITCRPVGMIFGNSFISLFPFSVFIYL